VEEGVEEEEEELQVVGVEEALTSTGEKRSSDRGGQTRHRLSPYLRRGKERHEAEAQEWVAERRLEPATTQHIGGQRRLLLEAKVDKAKLREREKNFASLSSLSPFTLFIRSTNSEIASHFFSSHLPFTLDTVRAGRGRVLVFEKEEREGRARALSTLEVGAGLHKEIKYLSLPFCTLFLRKREHPSGLSRRQR